MVLVSHGAAIRWVTTSVSDVPATFGVSTHLGNTELVVLAPDGAQGWVCEAYGPHVPPFVAVDTTVAPPV